ncbi:MAG TPA: FtsX-like permease family protein, partial [Acidimicrobiales bacterium]|nr:FtsX-like permease family protein [Acidimicrobiales bacterium]
MIRLGLRLTLGSGREALLRVVVTAAAVALGVGLLLCALAGGNGLHAQAERGAWLDTTSQSPPAVSAGHSSRLWWLLTLDQFGSQEIDRVDLAATGPGAPVPPGIRSLPGPGQYYASPALTSLLRSVPSDQLADRFPGHQVGVLGPSALPSPNALIIVIGRSATQLAADPGAEEVSGIQRTLSGCFSCQSGVGSGPVLQWILAGGAIALLLPVLILIATAGRLSAARREERFAAMRLVGATPRQITLVSAVEAVFAALAGVAVGFGLFFAFRPLLYRVPFTGAPFAPGDLVLSRTNVLVVLVGVPLAAVVSARLSLRRVQRAPLSVRARSVPAPPRVVRVVPLLA